MNSTDEQAASSVSQGSNLARWLVIAALCAMLVAACVLGYLGWTSTDTSVPASGYVALVLGVVFSLVVGVGLMALVFYSSRKGYDEPAVLIEEPESDPDDGQARSR
ncbi:hypothetical protein [Bradyrhizobium sp. MOS003]|jgi:TRAP-type C4-dicarboxylate transport system permease small subunit|uniref:hypothetical protein n=1 Tax=Bradyrhizobium sp. MOS003 TaxID=2133946 RepID=UPI000D11DE8A|nr:hypothetical protein [Bradyrhizobium sp. MOS003]PSO21915.1 hypothetical protein C7G42_09950 [Bradyrhizobium sp. MOS003]